MTAPAHRKPCASCSGRGIVPRERRRLPNGDLDPTDIMPAPIKTCPTCEGAGSVAFQPRPEEQPAIALAVDGENAAAGSFC
jgi:DnaJ-class molecular chaperone